MPSGVPPKGSGTADLRRPLLKMVFVKALLGALTLCGLLLGTGALALGPGHPGTASRPSGLTAASVLASDGMGPGGQPDEAGPAPRRPDRQVVVPASGLPTAG